MKTDIYNLKAEKVGTLELPESIFGLKWNPNLVHQVTESARANRRAGTAHAKGRGEVAGGGKKPWRQKGTGRARHGSIRSPIWVGGGVTHGPLKEKVYSKKINKKAGQKALFTVLARKNRDGEILIVDEIRLSESKTKIASSVFKALGGIPGFENLAKKGTPVIISPKDKTTGLAFRNISGVKTAEVRNLNTLDLLSAKFLVLGREDILNLTKNQKPKTND